MAKIENLNRFRNKELENLFKGFGLSSKSDFKNIERQLQKKLEILYFAEKWQDLLNFPANRPEKLKSSNLCSIRINLQYRLTFIWVDNKAWEIDINKHDKNYGK